MYKYEMMIDGVVYNAIFPDGFAACDFIEENEADGSMVVIEAIHGVSPAEILADSSFDLAYKVEVVAEYFQPGIAARCKVSELETYLRILGVLC